MLEPLTSSTGLLLALVALALVAVAILAVRVAMKLAVRVGIVAGVALAGLYTVGVIG
ncbi:hypothetical protein [Natronococcus jeotgali]|uniref:hypothetical protein n=1 Tax=Natronococcus jeotgali TaxID=413812 RepID=UPI0014614A48|nr:hypothetical protein [Natronococcus jeotgali]